MNNAMNYKQDSNFNSAFNIQNNKKINKDDYASNDKMNIIDEQFNNNKDYSNNINRNVNININGKEPEQIIKKKKNRTMQYYKFLFYSMKMEIKTVEFLDMNRFSNQSEISLWILSIALYETGFSQFVWYHILHFIRGLLGFIIILKFPKSGSISDQMNANKQDVENLIFNDLTRKAIKSRIIEPISKLKSWLIVYMILTLINFCIDIIDFLYQLSKFARKNNKYNERMYIFLNFLFASLYIGIFFLPNKKTIIFLYFEIYP